MKKILIATSALAFAGSAFAADVSGYVISAYKKGDVAKSLYNEAEVYFSGSKTTSNGLTFGATYTIGFAGDSGKAVVKDGTYTKTKYPPSGAFNNKSVTPATYTSANNKNAQYAEINAFVSGSFGKVEMGRHNVASRQLGTASIAAGSSINGGFTGDSTRLKTASGITYTSPVFSGVQIGYTMEPGKNKARSLGVKYSGTFSGVNVAVAYGSYQDKSATDELSPDDVTKLGASAKRVGYGVKVSKNGFSVSYSKATSKDAFVSIDKKTDPNKPVNEYADIKYTRIGLGYTAGKVTLGVAQRKIKYSSIGGVKALDIYAGYEVASGLTVFIESVKNSGYNTADKASAAGNTKTTWIGTNISF